MALLKIFDVSEGARDIAIGIAPIIIGREKGKVDLCLHDAAVSREHAKLYWVEGQYFVEDLDSSCGTLLNNVPTSVSQLDSGDHLQLGSTVIEFLDDDTSPEDSGQNKDTVDGLMSSYKTLPSQMKLSYRVLKVLAETTFSTGDTVVVGKCGLLIKADIEPEDKRNIIEVKLEWPDGNSRMLLAEVIATVQKGQLICIKLHHIPEFKLQTLFDKVERGCWVNVVID